MVSQVPHLEIEKGMMMRELFGSNYGAYVARSPGDKLMMSVLPKACSSVRCMISPIP